jgi:metal-responsive CopG/Arc/MetJ family transcriptional regulator
MNSITIRLDQNLEKLLEQELQLKKISRSDLVRQVLQDYLKQRKKDRLIQAMVREMKSLSPETRQEGLAITEEFLAVENEALELGESPVPYSSSPEGKDDRWWK